MNIERKARLPQRPTRYVSELRTLPVEKLHEIPEKYFGTLHFSHAAHIPYSVTGYRR